MKASALLHRLTWINLLLLSAGAASAQSSNDPLRSGFESPPDSAKPRVWWHWMNGNVTQEGVKADFEWMKKVGIGGVQNFDAAFDGWGPMFDTPKRVAKPLVYLTPDWEQAFRYSVKLASELGLEYTIAASPGWSETGGPWVKPEAGMKKLVWSEIYVKGGAPFKGVLKKPPQTSGVFQDLPAVRLNGYELKPGEGPSYYADAAVIAYRAPAADVPFESLNPVVTSSAGTIDAKRLWDGGMTNPLQLPFGEGQPAWIQFAFAKAQRIQGVTLMVGSYLGLDSMETREKAWLEASDDGKSFRKVAELFGLGAPQQTYAFAPTVARVFRVSFEHPKPSSLAQLGLGTPPTSHAIGELVLHTAARIARFEDKAGFANRQILPEDATPEPSVKNELVSKADIIDLTAKMRPDGSLDWTPPAGRWVVLRLGYSLTGRANHPASAAGTGLEVDKLNREYVKRYMSDFLDSYKGAVGAELMGRKGIQYVLTDSFEAGASNWTDDMLAQFKKRRGYAALPWLPVLVGRVVQDAAASERFLWDFRKTLADLIAESHYAQVGASLHERGLGHYGESHEAHRAFIGDGMQAKKNADVPMGSMWASLIPGTHMEVYDADILESASVAHIYGQNLVAAESLTVCGANAHGFTPETLKPTADRMLARGLNRFVIHTSVHQPDNQPGPGMSLGACGQWFTRKETWAPQAAAWVGYLSRSSFLLQQGRFIADIAYLYGEDINITTLFESSAPEIPQGYNFDFVNTDILINELAVKDGRLVTRSGMAYRVLALDPASTRQLTVPVLRRLRDLVRAGAVVTGAKPSSSPSLADDPAQFRALVAELWGDTAGERAVGAGKVYANRSLADTLQSAGVAPDISFGAPAGTELRFVHRSLKDGDLYFISNATDKPVAVEADLRVSGKKPELWRADTATVEPVSYRIENGRTSVPLKLAANDAVFVVLRQPAAASSATVPEQSSQMLTTLEGAWDVSFPPNLGAPAQARFETLSSWSESTDAGVKYFSGAATYSKTVKVRRNWLKNGARVQLDLGAVKNVAELLVNGRSMGTVWKAPYKLDITDALKSGDNRLEVKVSNLWPNRLIGDKQPGARQIAFAAFDPFKADSPLLPSGLLGPVTLWAVSL